MSAITAALALALFLSIQIGSSSAAIYDKGRDPSVQPFDNASVWNIPLGDQAIYGDRVNPESQALQTDDYGGRKRSYPWVGFDATAVYRSKRSDPLKTWIYEGRSSSVRWSESNLPLNHGELIIRTPPEIKFLGASDKTFVIIDETGNFAYEGWLGEYDSARSVYRVRYIARTDLRGSGIARRFGDSDGIRAFGGSILGGLIRCSELESGLIEHAVAILISPTQAKAGVDARQQTVWPATNSDNGGRNSYSGVIPLGRLLAIPTSVQINSLKLSPPALALARALQLYGGYVVDTATDTTSVGTVEHGCPRSTIDSLLQDARIIRNELRPVLNSAPESIGGAGRRLAVPPRYLQNRR